MGAEVQRAEVLDQLEDSQREAELGIRLEAGLGSLQGVGLQEDLADS